MTISKHKISIYECKLIDRFKWLLRLVNWVNNACMQFYSHSKGLCSAPTVRILNTRTQLVPRISMQVVTPRFPEAMSFRPSYIALLTCCRRLLGRSSFFRPEGMYLPVNSTDLVILRTLYGFNKLMLLEGCTTRKCRRFLKGWVVRGLVWSWTVTVNYICRD